MAKVTGISHTSVQQIWREAGLTPHGPAQSLRRSAVVTALEGICLIPCEEFGDLKRAIAAYRFSASP